MANQTEREFTATLLALLNDFSELSVEEIVDLGTDEEDAVAIAGMEAVDFRDEGIMTSNEGLTVRLPNGRSFQLTVVRSV